MRLSLTRLAIILSAIFCLACALPQLFLIIAKKKDDTPYITYSAVLKDFLIAEHSGRSRYKDRAGNSYTLREYERLMPFVFTRDLLKWGEYPEEIDGVYIPPDRAETDWDSISVSYASANAANRRIQLFPLFESESEFSSIAAPAELFRIAKRMEFINAARNSVNEEKSLLFTQALTDAGFSFPPKMIAGNPTNHKPYDFGYFIVDAEGVIFRIYQAKGMPMIEKTGISVQGEIFFMKVRENPNLAYYGLLATDLGKVFLILKDNYHLQELWVEGYNPFNDRLVFGNDPLNITLKVFNEGGERIYASTQNGEALKSFSYSYPRPMRYAAVYDALFPFTIKSNPTKEGGFWWINFSKNTLLSLCFCIALALIYAAAARFYYKASPIRIIVDAILIAISGIYALIPIILESFDDISR
ncbi:MAG: DUF4857 domain-containing protein [Deferribacteraceae bacterium]|jgi:hypothetical protein|nr:DUF4857 domain-containing protein [Deferribacteraceae bacterium]